MPKDDKAIGEQVISQYDDDHARTFYRYVMGAGTQNIHFGIFRSEAGTILDAALATNTKMLQTLDWARPVDANSHVLDLGSGTGGLSHALMQTFGCRVTSYNISPEQNKENVAEAVRLGLDASKHMVVLGDFNNGLPAEWTATLFSHVISCEVLCHAASQTTILTQVMEVLEPGGALVFSDIMGADGADEAQLKDFTDRNATVIMSRPQQYRELLPSLGYDSVGYYDGSHHLQKYFDEMLRQIADNRAEMLAEGVPEPYLQQWEGSLAERSAVQKASGVFAWGIFEARKSGPVKYSKL